MGRILVTAAIAAMALLALPATASAGQLKAGVAVLDASWHVGASAGQYASDGSFANPANGTYDPTAHSTRREASYGRQSDLQVRALVVEGPDGKRTALVKNDLYIAQDLIWRRTAQILATKGVGIDQTNLTMAVSHDHSSPFYSSTSWGVWTFQDVFDIRFYSYYAERMAAAVEKAAKSLKPVRVGASVSRFDKTARHSFGPAIADDGTPAGYPQSDIDSDMTVVRFDDISDPGNPKPLANIVNFGLHPEFLNGNDLISGDYVAPLEAMADRATGAVTIWTQNAVGTAEPERSVYHPIRERLEFTHKEYGQAEYGARLMANSITETWRDVARGKDDPDFGGDADRWVEFRSDFAANEVSRIDRWFPGPVTHPYPGVSNCKSAPAFAGDPRIPIAGLPDCVPASDALNQLSDFLGLPDPPDTPETPFDPGLDSDDFKRLGVPVPDNYAAPGYTGLQEDINVHLQAFRIGDILFAVCACEQWADQSRNIETRTDRVPDNEYLGWDWKTSDANDDGQPDCVKNGDGSYGDGPEGYGTGTWTCRDPRNLAQSLPPLTDQEVERMSRQVTNPANGWNDVEYAPQADSEPPNLREIKGNYTHDDRCGDPSGVPEDDWNEPCDAGESSPSAQLGYKLTVPIAMANDYNGYIATYREFQRGDHYRKALTGWGPHSSDYMATRLVNMGRVLAGGDAAKLLPEEFGAFKVPADLAVNEARARALGAGGDAAIAGYEARLPDDGGDPGAVTQPADVERFDGTFFSWIGGSNFTDDPRVTVERMGAGGWRRYAGQASEIPITLEFPAADEAPAYESGGKEWRWTAHFEAFASRFDTVEGSRSTPAGTYRFVVRGRHRKDREAKDYAIESKPFEVKPWSGITIEDMRVDGDGRVSMKVGPRTSRTLRGGGPDLTTEIGPIDYPDTYTYPGGAPQPRFIKSRLTGVRDPAAPADPAKVEWFCFTCSFRPWIDFGDAETVELTVVGGSGTETVAARREGDRWVSERALAADEAAYVGAGCARDAFGDFNGSASAVVGAAGVAADRACPIPKPDPGPGAGTGGSGGSETGGPGRGPDGSGGGSQQGGAHRAGCASPGRLRGKALGGAVLGRARARNRRGLTLYSRPRRVMDRFCLSDGRFERVGYPSAALLRSLSRSERRRVRGRAIFMTSSSAAHSAFGRRPGSSARGLRGRRFKVGANLWVLRRGRRATVLFKVRRGKVLEVGLGDARLTRGRAAARRYLRSFS